MPKFGLLHRHLLETGVARAEQFHRPAPPPDSLLHRVHSPGYVAAFTDGTIAPDAIRRIGLPWSAELVRRTRIAVAGTVLTTQLAMRHGLACNTAGGTHHAFAGFGSGFCIFNDLAVAARHALDHSGVRQVLIIDLDVHQGDGTADLLAAEPRAFTFSMHCERNFPLRKRRSDLDVALPVGCDDHDYLETLDHELGPLLDRVRPDLVLYDAGVDVHGGDRLGRLSLTDRGLLERDTMVLEACVGRGIATACVIGGGYSHDHQLLAARHATLHRAAAAVFDRRLA
jgi:acetoin utilization deacetylase AcuC-like enzyme